MTTRKNPGLGARAKVVSAAVAAAGKASKGAEEEKPKIKGVGIRMPAALHRELRRISYEQEVSLNDLLVEGTHMVIAERDKRRK